jgi:hypothetical protein
MKRHLATALVAALTGCAGTAYPALSDAPMPPAATIDHTGVRDVVGEYFSLAKDSDVAWKDRLTASTPFDKLTRLYVNGGWLKPDNTGKYTLQLQFPYETARLAQLLGAVRARNPSAEILIVSGFDADGAMYRGALKDPSYFAQSVVSFMRANRLDGYDCDWENGLAKKGVNRLAAAVRQALTAAGKADGKHYLFTMAVWPNPFPGYYDLPRLSKLLDQIEIMSYGPGDKLPDDAASYVKDGFARNKIVGGVETERDYDGPGGVDTLGPSGSVAAKAGYARKNGLAGMMAWRLDNDYNVNKKPTYAGAKQLWNSMTLP